MDQLHLIFTDLKSDQEWEQGYSLSADWHDCAEEVPAVLDSKALTKCLVWTAVMEWEGTTDITCMIFGN